MFARPGRIGWFELPRFCFFAVTLCLAVAVCRAVDPPEEKLAVPDADAQQAAEKQTRAVFKSDYENSRTPAQKLEFAKKLYRHGLTMDDDPVARFVLLQTSRKLAMQAGQADVALQAVDGLEKFYDVNALELKAEALEAVAAKLRTAEDHRQMLAPAMALVEQALAAERLDLAKSIGERGLSSAKKANDAAVVKKITARMKVVQALDKAQQRSQAAVAALQKNPADAAAHLALGEYLCFMKDNWDQGLSHLAQASDATLKSLATRERAAPAAAAEQLTLADAWFDLGQKRAGYLFESQIKSHAGQWYEKALAGLTGLDKTKAERRLQELAAAADDAEAGLPLRDRGRVVFLDDLPEGECKVGFGKLGKHGRTGFPADDATQPQFVNFRGESPKHALSTHAQSEGAASVVYPLNKQAMFFRAAVGIFSHLDPPPQPASPLVFKVFGDGKLLWQSNPVQAAHERQMCRILVAGVTELKLQVDCSGHAARGYAVWIEPQLTTTKKSSVSSAATSGATSR